jgi:hypothetical protein
MSDDFVREWARLSAVAYEQVAQAEQAEIRALEAEGYRMVTGGQNDSYSADGGPTGRCTTNTQASCWRPAMAHRAISGLRLSSRRHGGVSAGFSRSRCGMRWTCRRQSARLWMAYHRRWRK